MTALEKKLAGAIVELIDEVVKLHPQLEPALKKVQGVLRLERRE